MHFRIVLLLGILSCGAVAVAESQDTTDSQNVSYDDLAIDAKITSRSDGDNHETPSAADGLNKKSSGRRELRHRCGNRHETLRRQPRNTRNTRNTNQAIS